MSAPIHKFYGRLKESEDDTMMNLKALSTEMQEIGSRIEKILRMTGYSEFGDLSGLSDFYEISSPDDRQMLEVFDNALLRLEDVLEDALKYHNKPIKETSLLHRNADGKFETGGGHCYRCGMKIEFLRKDEVCLGTTGEWGIAETWTTSRLEHNGQDYFIIGFPEIKLPKLKVRVRR